MANSCYTYRTNYFKVKDENRLKEIANSIGAELFKKDDNLFGFGALEIDYSYDNYYDDENKEYETIEEIQKILEDDETCVIIENSNEKLRYVSSFITIITKDKIDVYNILDFLSNHDITKKYNNIITL